MEEISKQSIEGAAWVLFTALVKFKEERDKLKKEEGSVKYIGTKIGDLKHSKPTHIAKE